jgi:hypothetical protein
MGSVADRLTSWIRIFPSWILGHNVTGSRVIKSLDQDPQQRISVFLPKQCKLSSRKYDPRCLFRIPDRDVLHPLIPDPGVSKAPDPGSGSPTLIVGIHCPV